MASIRTCVGTLGEYHEALELAEKVGLSVVDVELGGKWSCPNHGSYHMQVPGNELRAIGKDRVFINTVDGVKKCKPSSIPDNNSRIEITFTDE
jgi:hypothetical protein